MKRLKKTCADSRGTTLIESICGLLILTIVLGAVYTAVIAAQNALAQGDRREMEEQEAFALLEQGGGMEIREETLTLPLGGKSVSLQGKLLRSNGTGEAAVLYLFGSNAAADPASALHGLYIRWYRYFSSFSDPKQAAADAGMSNWNNHQLREWLRESEKGCGGNWPLLPSEIVEAAGESGDFYIQATSYWGGMGKNAEKNCFVYAYPTENHGKGNVQLVFDHQEKAWYYGSGGVSIANRSWAEIRSEIHKDTWIRLD